MIKEAGLKFVPFILMGPFYAAPEWWLEDERHVGLVCLEHGRESPIDSIWNPFFREEADRVLKAFSEHYLPMDILESVPPGICGDYGPLNLEDDNQDIYGACAFSALLDDVLENYSKDLRIAGGEVVRGEIGDKLYALYPNGEIKEV